VKFHRLVYDKQANQGKDVGKRAHAMGRAVGGMSVIFLGIGAREAGEDIPARTIDGRVMAATVG
jgi:hypothetical protein